MEQIHLALAQGWSILRNPPETLPVLPDSPECAALRADMQGDRLNSRFHYIHEDESIKAHGVV